MISSPIIMLTSSHFDPRTMVISGSVFLLIALLYYPVLESSNWQGTLGKKTMKIAVVDENNQRIAFSKSLLRHLLRSFLGFGVVLTLFHDKKQSLHDILCKTYVKEK